MNGEHGEQVVENKSGGDEDTCDANTADTTRTGENAKRTQSGREHGMRGCSTNIYNRHELGRSSPLIMAVTVSHLRLVANVQLAAAIFQIPVSSPFVALPLTPSLAASYLGHYCPMCTIGQTATSWACSPLLMLKRASFSMTQFLEGLVVLAAAKHSIADGAHATLHVTHKTGQSPYIWRRPWLTSTPAHFLYGAQSDTTNKMTALSSAVLFSAVGVSSLLSCAVAS
ncbi:hypothetical protein O3P69_017954 [Scylla paramamosain]|uniref:Uncharacterized protein n=1 Tax=Scylla paramamosain TaxID=85552 RepID=A0AAW0TJQ7_SCYPA